MLKVLFGHAFLQMVAFLLLTEQIDLLLGASLAVCVLMACAGWFAAGVGTSAIARSALVAAIVFSWVVFALLAIVRDQDGKCGDSLDNPACVRIVPDQLPIGNPRRPMITPQS